MSLKPRRKLPAIPLTGRVVLALVAVGMVPFLISAYQIRNGRQAVVDQVQRTHLVAAVATAERVGAEIDLLRSLGTSTLEHPVLRDAPASDTARALLTGMLTARAELVAAGLFVDPADESQARRPLPELVQIARRGAERRATDEVIADLDARPVAVVVASDRSWLRLRVPLSGSKLFLLLLADLEPIEAALRPDEVGEAVEMALWDRGQGILAGGIASNPVLPPSLEGLVGRAASAVDELEVANGPAEVSAFAAVPGSPWLVITRQPAAVAAHAATAQRRLALRAFAFVLLLTGAFAWSAHRGIVEPIRQMLAEQRDLAGGASFGEGGEISQLREAFVLLTRNLHDREALSKVFLGRYRVIAMIGAGAMGSVFRGWDPRLERAVALKTMRADLPFKDRPTANGAATLAEQLEREAVTLARLNHSNIVTVYDAESDGERAFVAMELVEGISLERYLGQEGQMPVEQTVSVGVAVARALAAAHKAGVVHQDIKPGNILLGNDGSIKVTDFGIAELFGRAAVDDAPTREHICGTPGFLAPEVARGGHATPQSDLFALGVVLYQCLTGRRPFVGKSAQEALVATVTHDPMPLAELRRDVPAALAAVVSELLAKRPGDRTRDADAAVRALIAAVPTADPTARIPIDSFTTVPSEPTRQDPRNEAAHVPTTQTAIRPSLDAPHPGG